MNTFATIKTIGFSLVGAVLLSGCAFKYNGMEQATSAADRFPITVSEDTTTMELAIQPGQTRLSGQDKMRLGMLASEYRQRGHGAMKLSLPAGSPNGQSAASLSSKIKRVLSDAGVGSSAVVQSSYAASASDSDAPIMISFTRYVASVSECGYWNDNMANNSRNTPHVNFGCATQNNVAAMVQDPHDFIAPRGMTAADPARRSIVFEKYREGSPTATARTEAERGTVSEVD